MIWIEAVFNPIQDKKGNIVNILIISRDISERKQLQMELEYMAYHDYLTGLYNRRKMRIVMDHCINEENDKNKKLAIIILDLDKFKNINDTFGHDVGDLVLKEFSRRLLVIKTENDIVGRLSGDEFTILMKNIDETDEFINKLLYIRKILNAHFNIPELDIEISIKSSLGYSLFPDHGNTVASLFKYADNSLYKEKRRRIKLAQPMPCLSKQFK